MVIRQHQTQGVQVMLPGQAVINTGHHRTLVVIIRATVCETMECIGTDWSARGR